MPTYAQSSFGQGGQTAVINDDAFEVTENPAQLINLPANLAVSIRALYFHTETPGTFFEIALNTNTLSLKDKNLINNYIPVNNYIPGQIAVALRYYTVAWGISYDIPENYQYHMSIADKENLFFFSHDNKTRLHQITFAGAVKINNSFSIGMNTRFIQGTIHINEKSSMHIANSFIQVQNDLTSSITGVGFSFAVFEELIMQNVEVGVIIDTGNFINARMRGTFTQTNNISATNLYTIPIREFDNYRQPPTITLGISWFLGKTRLNSELIVSTLLIRDEIHQDSIEWDNDSHTYTAPATAYEYRLTPNIKVGGEWKLFNKPEILFRTGIATEFGNMKLPEQPYTKADTYNVSQNIISYHIGFGIKIKKVIIHCNGIGHYGMIWRVVEHTDIQNNTTTYQRRDTTMLGYGVGLAISYRPTIIRKQPTHFTDPISKEAHKNDKKDNTKKSKNEVE